MRQRDHGERKRPQRNAEPCAGSAERPSAEGEAFQGDHGNARRQCYTYTVQQDRSGQNITITLPNDVLRDAKHLAVDAGVPLSHFVADLVRAKVTSSRFYEQARHRSLARMQTETGFRLGPMTWTREDLHRR